MNWVLALTIAMQLSGAQEEATIKTVLEDQTTAWNRGDIEEFMKGYENSKDLTFVGKSVSRGYDAVLARYRRDYGDKLISFWMRPTQDEADPSRAAGEESP